MATRGLPSFTRDETLLSRHEHGPELHSLENTGRRFMMFVQVVYDSQNRIVNIVPAVSCAEALTT